MGVSLSRMSRGLCCTSVSQDYTMQLSQPGNAGVGRMQDPSVLKRLQPCPGCDPTDCRPQGSSVHGILRWGYWSGFMPLHTPGRSSRLQGWNPRTPCLERADSSTPLSHLEVNTVQKIWMCAQLLISSWAPKPKGQMAVWTSAPRGQVKRILWSAQGVTHAAAASQCEVIAIRRRILWPGTQWRAPQAGIRTRRSGLRQQAPERQGQTGCCGFRQAHS